MCALRQHIMHGFILSCTPRSGILTPFPISRYACGHIIRFIPGSIVEKRALEGMKTWNGWPAPSIGNTSYIDEEVITLLVNSSVFLADFDNSFRVLMVPLGANNRNTEANYSLRPYFSTKSFK